MQTKFDESISNTKEPDNIEPFMNTGLIRNVPNNSESNFVSISYSYPTPAEAQTSALSGTSLSAGDRIVEEGTGYMLIVRGIAQYRERFLSHDEVTCSEASQLDKRWIEPFQILDATQNPTGQFYDQLRKQYININISTDTNKLDAFGIFQPFDDPNYNRDAKVVKNIEIGKEISPRHILYIDADFNLKENQQIFWKEQYWRVTFVREALTRVLLCGLNPWKQKGAGKDEVHQNHQRNIVQ